MIIYLFDGQIDFAACPHSLHSRALSIARLVPRSKEPQGTKVAAGSAAGPTAGPAAGLAVAGPATAAVLPPAPSAVAVAGPPPAAAVAAASDPPPAAAAVGGRLLPELLAVYQPYISLILVNDFPFRPYS